MSDTEKAQQAKPLKVAILGWGSLIPEPAPLRIVGNWCVGGPSLKIEFSRISANGRLTLVIDQKYGSDVVTQYVESAHSEIEDAVCDLMIREGTGRKNIGVCDKHAAETRRCNHPEAFTAIRDWLLESEFDAVIWTDLKSNYREKRDRDFTLDDALNYLNSLPVVCKADAQRYIETAPETTQTRLRRFLGERGFLTIERNQHLKPHSKIRVKALEGNLSAAGKRFGIVVSRFNAFITERLLQSALDGLVRCGAKQKDLQVVRVPGAFEIPSAARTLADTKKYDAIICIGCLLRGDTAHYDVIVNEVARGIGQSAQETGVPHAFGVLTCETLEQAIDRAGLKMGNKGFEAALAAVEMANLKAVVSRRSSVVSKSPKRKSNSTTTDPSR